jgi:hypothetical protein
LHLAVDTATYSFRSFGIFLIFAGLVVALAAVFVESPPMMTIGILLLIAGLPLLIAQRWLLRHAHEQVRTRLRRTLTLLGLQCEEPSEHRLLVRVPPMQIDLRPLGLNSTVVRFRGHQGGHEKLKTRSRLQSSRHRECLVIQALIKTHKTIRLII